MEDALGWIKEGWKISLRVFDEPETFYFIRQARVSKYDFLWPKDVASDTENGPELVKDLKPGRMDILSQFIFGIKPNVYIYLNLPRRERLHGLDEYPIADATHREVGAFTQEISPFESPNFITEHFLRRESEFEFPALVAYNPTNVSLRPVIRFYVNRMLMERITESDTIEKLRKRQIPFRPIVMGPLPGEQTGRG